MNRAELYTSLVRAKQELNGGSLPPMTPVPESVHWLIDPAFTPGFGALEEHPEKGLRCPVRGCGKYRHQLAKHVNAIHRNLGGAAAIKRALSIPSNAPLASRSLRQKYSANMKRLVSEKGLFGGRPIARYVTQDHRKRVRVLRATMRSVGVRNFRLTCEAQIAHRLIDLEHRLGRSPTSHEAEVLGELNLVYACRRLYGSWNAAKAAAGLACYNAAGGRVIGTAAILEQMAAWYAEHGTLPTSYEAKNTRRTPLIPGYTTIIKYFGPTWGDSMRAIATRLRIRGGRYGLPERDAAVEAAA